MNESELEKHPIFESLRKAAREVLETGQLIITTNDVKPDSEGFYTVDVPMGHNNPQGEIFIQWCGLLSQFGIKGVEFPEVEQIEEQEITLEEIHTMDTSRTVKWNPTLIEQFLNR